MEHFSYKGGCGIHEHICVSRRLKEELAWVIDKRLRVISNAMLFVLNTVCYGYLRSNFPGCHRFLIHGNLCS